MPALIVAVLISPTVAAAQNNTGASATSGAAALPEIQVIGTTPLPPPPRPSRGAGTATPAQPQTAPAAQPGAIDIDKVPSNVQVLPASAFDHTITRDLLQAMERALPGVALSSQTGNEFQQDINYRGYIASPVIGTPQGIAVYQNGVRINEVFGDIVNWDFIPEKAINGMTLVPSNPIYGLNAIGGALALEMKNGFTYHGVEGELLGGSFGRVGASAQAGGQNGNLSGYIAIDAIDDGGWRQDSPSSLHRVYTDLGARGDATEFHVTFTGASNGFGATAATPVQMLAQDWSSIYTVPQTTQNQLAFLTASASWKPSDTLAYQAVLYYRNFHQAHVDGNGTDAQYCDPPKQNFLCFQDGATPLFVTGSSQQVSAGTVGPASFLGEIDRTWTTTNSFGGSAQMASSAAVFSHGNNFVVGASVDRGLVQFSTTSELGTINPSQFPTVQGVGLFINEPQNDVAPVGLGATTLYTGLYATDTFDVTPRLAVTAGARFNFAQIVLADELGNAPQLSGGHEYAHFNPMAGATYKLTPNVTLFGDYAVTNRAPTPLELECSDPTRPCLIDNALVGDPNLQQVVTYTGEAGLRGHYEIGTGKLNWALGVYRALNTNDIINVASAVPGFESFQNAGNTLRQGVEASASYKWDRWNAYANFTYVDATFRNYLTLSSPFNPAANQTTGNINVVPGDHLAGIPDFRFKAGVDYQITNPWKLGADLNVIGSQYLVGDESNQNPKVPAYWTVNLHTSYKLGNNIELFGLVRNLFDQHYYLYGTFFDVTSFPYLGLTDPRTFIPGMPFAFYAGVRGSLPAAGPAFEDMARPVLAKAPAPPPSFDWSGVYLGVNGGYSLGGSDWSDAVTGQSSGSFGTSGFVLGGTLGANYQSGAWVFGLEADGGWADASGAGTLTQSGLCPGGCNTTDSWLATLRGRAGYAVDRFLAYGTAGAAFGDVRAGYSNHAVSAATKSGWTVGAGVEVAIAPHWTAKAEYLFVDLADGSCTAACAIADPSGAPPLIPNISVKFDESIVRGGINYKFGF